MIYHLTDCLGEVGELWLEKVFDTGAYISVITRIEILGWSKHSAKSLNEAAELLTKVQELSLNEEIIKNRCTTGEGVRSEDKEKTVDESSD